MDQGGEDSVWWPIPAEELDDLRVEEVEGGFEFSAPEGTPCGKWLRFWNETEERRERFSKEVLKSILEHAGMQCSW